ncbi:hypothetical protein CR513_18595, partial [Mucuna pruriens]
MTPTRTKRRKKRCKRNNYKTLDPRHLDGLRLKAYAQRKTKEQVGIDMLRGTPMNTASRVFHRRNVVTLHYLLRLVETTPWS